MTPEKHDDDYCYSEVTQATRDIAVVKEHQAYQDAEINEVKESVGGLADKVEEATKWVIRGLLSIGGGATLLIIYEVLHRVGFNTIIGD